VGKESYIDEYTRKERMGIIWLKAGIWKLRGIRRVLREEGAPYAKHVLLKCSETKKKWREECVNSNWLNIKEDLAYRKKISYTNINKIEYLGKH
jgi:hypothetical protein